MTDAHTTIPYDSWQIDALRVVPVIITPPNHATVCISFLRSIQLTSLILFFPHELFIVRYIISRLLNRSSTSHAVLDRCRVLQQADRYMSPLYVTRGSTDPVVKNSSHELAITRLRSKPAMYFRSGTQLYWSLV